MHSRSKYLFLIPLLLAACAGSELQAIQGPGLLPPLAPRAGHQPGQIGSVPVPDPERKTELSLDEAVSYARQHAPGMKRARALRARGHAELLAARPLLPANPQLGATVGPRMASGGAAPDVEVSLSQAVELGGQRGLRREAAERFAELVEQQVTEARWTLGRSVVQAYFAAMVAREQLRNDEEGLGFAHELAGIARKRLKAGDISALEQELATVEVKQAQQSLATSKGSYRAARIRLAAELGWPVHRLPAPSSDFRAVIDLPPVQRLEQKVLDHFPALQTLALTLKRAQARVALADREAWPGLELGVSYAREGDPSWSGGEVNLVLFNVGIELPLWRQNLAGRARSRAELSMARVDLAVTRERLRGRLARAHAEVQGAVAGLRLFDREVLPLRRKILDKMRRAFALGEVDLLQVFMARGQFLSSRREALRARAEYGRALVELEALVGPLARPAGEAQQEKKEEKTP